MRKCPIRGCHRYYTPGKYRRCVVHQYPEPWQQMERAQRRYGRRQTLKSLAVFSLLVAGVFAVGSLVQSDEATDIDDPERLSHYIGWSPAIESDRLARDIAARVNDERLERGLRPLEWHDGLAALARDWSERMIDTGYRHSPDSFRVHPEFAGIGENILMGHSDTMHAHVGWVESDGHRQNLLTPEYTAIGIGVVCRNDGVIWATQLFGWPHGVASSEERSVPPVEPILRRDRGLRC